MRHWHLFDSIAWWLSINMISAILLALLMSLAFVEFAGVWAEPPLESTGLIAEACGMVRAMDQMPPADRPQLAGRLTTLALGVHWYPSREQVPIIQTSAKSPHDLRWSKIRDLLGRPDAGVLGTDIYHPDWPHEKTRSTEGAKYLLAVELRDRSWIGFSASHRSWGISYITRRTLTAVLILVSSVVIASVASRKLARPIQQLAQAADMFGSGSRAESLQLSGPREIRDAATAFNAMQERIQQLMDSHTEMLTAISHDLRAPLTRMRLRGEFVDEPEQQRKLFRDVDEMQAMIEASLTFFRQDGREEEVTRVDLIELLQSVLDDFSDMNFSVAMLDAPPKLIYHARPLALKRALVNLVDNAVRYGNSTIVTVNLLGEKVLITVDDNGPGVAPEMIPKLFVPFYRGEPSRNRATGGFGLGLASALSIIRSHRGELTLENRQPHGLRATVALPILSTLS